MFECPGVPLLQGWWRYFNKIIQNLQPRPQRKYTYINLDRSLCALQEVCSYTPSDETIWKSIPSVTLQCLTREFLWKCIHNTFRVGDFWYHIDTLEIKRRCHVCGVLETLEHIALECDTPGQKIDLGPNAWNLVQEIWPLPGNELGLFLSCNLVKFKIVKGIILPEKGRLFAILVSIAWHQIWNLRITRVITSPGRTISTTEIF
jgi:hypothetical protein